MKAELQALLALAPDRTNRNSSVGTANDYEGWVGNSVKTAASMPARGPTLPHVKLVPGIKRPGRVSDLYLMPRSRMVELYLHFTIHLDGLVFN
jgi:hypothetical protein